METTRKQLAEKLLASLQAKAGEPLACDTPALMASLEGEALQLHQLPIKIISVLGGLLSAMLFTGFLLALGMWESGGAMFMLGVVFIGCSLLVVNKDVSTYFSATAIAFLFIGLLLFGVGLGISSDSMTLVCLALMLACGVLFMTTTNGLVLFLITLVFLGSFLGLLLQTEDLAVLHFLVALLAALLLGWCLAEPELITATKQINEAYRPVRMGLLFSFGILMVMLSGAGSYGYIRIPYYWVSGLMLLLALFIFVWYSLQRLQQEGERLGAARQYGFLLLPLLMLPMIQAPGVVGSFLLILLAFYIRHLPSLVMGIVAFGYTLFLFYYDLHLTLLEKSGMLLLSGGWFLVGYILVKRYAK